MGPPRTQHSADRQGAGRVPRRRPSLLQDLSVPHYSLREPKSLHPFHDFLRERVRQVHPLWLPTTVLVREIRERGYHSGVS